MRDGARNMMFTPASLRAAETETQGWIQFETVEYIQVCIFALYFCFCHHNVVIRCRQGDVRDQVLDLMAQQGPNRAAGFIGPFDAVIRGGDNPQVR